MKTATALHLMPTAEPVEPVEQKETALVTLPQAKAEDIFIKGIGIDELIAAATEKALTVTIYADSAKGRDEIRSMAYMVTRTKTAVEAVRKALADEYKEKPKKIDAHGKKFRDAFEALYTRVREPLTKWEEAEKARIEAIKNTIQTIKDEGVKANGSAHAIGLSIEFIESYVIDDAYQEFQGEAQGAKDSVLAKLYAMHSAAVKAEAEAAELTRLREGQEKRDQADREARIAKEAAETATREAEEKAGREKAESEARELRAKLAQKEAEEAAAQAVADADKKAKDAVEAERRRVEAEATRLQAEEAKRESDNTIRFRVHSMAVADIQALGISKEKAVELVYAIRDGQVRNITLKY